MEPRFVDTIPRELEDGVLYFAMEYGTVLHKCCCGCGSEVNTPLSPTDWNMKYDGKKVSLSPSIGNWDYHCRSHYWIIENEVVWARSWSQSEVEENRREYPQVKIETDGPKKMRDKNLFIRIWDWLA
tara:strand:+ start:249 stop:629 length:381 start_codon:yes stop_codon:yes gene_type:complete